MKATDRIWNWWISENCAQDVCVHNIWAQVTRWEKIALVVLFANKKKETEKDHSPAEGDVLAEESILVVERVERNPVWKPGTAVTSGSQNSQENSGQEGKNKLNWKEVTKIDPETGSLINEREASRHKSCTLS